MDKTPNFAKEQSFVLEIFLEYKKIAQESANQERCTQWYRYMLVDEFTKHA